MVGCNSLTEEYNNDISCPHAHLSPSCTGKIPVLTGSIHIQTCGLNHIQQPYHRQGSKVALNKPEPVLNTVLLPAASDR